MVVQIIDSDRHTYAVPDESLYKGDRGVVDMHTQLRPLSSISQPQVTFLYLQILGLSTGNLQGNLTGPLKAFSTCEVTVAASPWNTPIAASALMVIISSTRLPLPIAAMALPWL